MHVVQRGKRFVVIDDCLGQEDLVRARAMLDRSTFRTVNSVIATPDGPAQRSRGIRFGAEIGEPDGGRPRPYEVLASAVRGQADLFGQAGSDWDTIGFTFWKYACGSRLGWHDDAGGGRLGEFILFLHPQWRPSWGGELMLLDEHPADLDWSGLQDRPGAARVEEAVLRAPSSPVAIVPRPNRLVMVRSETIHQINRVDVTAAAERRTLTGFVSRQGRDRAGGTTARHALLDAFAG